MKSLKALYRKGPGPSSSHTIGPKIATLDFLHHIGERNVDEIRAVLYGSLALTGVGHHTPDIIKNTIYPTPCNVKLDINTPTRHPNTVKFSAYDKGVLVIERTYESIGGGEITCLEDPSVESKDIYNFASFNDIKHYMKAHHMNSIPEFVMNFEDSDIREYLMDIALTMFHCIKRGLSTEGKVRAGKELYIDRVAKRLYKEEAWLTSKEDRNILLTASYAYAVSEENADGGEVVTAPTCGSAGVLPAVLFSNFITGKVSMEGVIDALMVAGIVGNIFKQNATISGAVGGCQAEIGVAICMASAALCSIDHLGLAQIEYAAELAMEHQLGLTCDPIDGYVAIPCIERNAVGAVRATESYLFAKWMSGNRKSFMSLDDIVLTMKMTGDNLSKDYKETAQGGISLVGKAKEERKNKRDK